MTAVAGKLLIFDPLLEESHRIRQVFASPGTQCKVEVWQLLPFRNMRFVRPKIQGPEMSGGLSAVALASPAGVLPSPAPEVAGRYTVVIPAITEPTPDVAQRRLLGVLTATELMAEIVAMDGGLDFVL